MTRPAHVTSNVERFSGFADRYDAYRPQPPEILVEILARLAQVDRPKVVVDLGSGTGLSTCIWAGHADAVIGVEPNADMRGQAERRAAGIGATNVRFVEAYATETGLPDAWADIVTCSQALHWMEPGQTFAEVARLLRESGVFAAIDCDWPPTLNWQAEAAYVEFASQAQEIGERRGLYRGVEQWAKDRHLARMEASGRFRYVKEILVHHREMGNAERLVGLALSQGSVAALLKSGLSEAEFGLDKFRERCRQLIGDDPAPWYFSYRVRLGVK